MKFGYGYRISSLELGEAAKMVAREKLFSKSHGNGMEQKQAEAIHTDIGLHYLS